MLQFFVNASYDITDLPGSSRPLVAIQRRTRGIVGRWGTTEIDGRTYLDVEIRFPTRRGALAKFAHDQDAYSVTMVSRSEISGIMISNTLKERGSVIF
jgi:hypothetical protein